MHDTPEIGIGAWVSGGVRVLRQIIYVALFAVMMTTVVMGGMFLMHGPSWLIGKAERGDPGAQYRLGRAYMRGDSVNMNFKKGFGWYHLAARNGSAAAMTAIGRAYEEGVGGQRDYGKALTWYRSAAAAGNPGAHLRIGALYARGRGVSQNRRTAWAWRIKAVRAAYTRAIKGTITAYRDSVRNVHTAFTIAHESLQQIGEMMSLMRSALNARRHDPLSLQAPQL